MLGSIPNHNTTIGTHCCDDVRVLRLIPGLVDLTLVVNLLDNVELDLHLGLFGSATVATNLSFVLIIILWVRCIGVRKLDMGNLEVVLSIASGMGTNQKAMSGIGLVRDSAE